MLKPITEEQLLQQKIEMLTAENKKLKNDASKLHQSAKDLQMKYHALVSANRLLEATNENKSRHLEDLMNLNDRYEAQVTRLQNATDTDLATIKRLHDLVDDYTNALDGARQFGIEQQEEILALEKDVRDLESIIKQLKQKD